MRLRILVTITMLIIGVVLPTAIASARERYAFEAFPPPGSEVEETGNLYVMSEGEEPEALELWGRNPSVDTRGRLIAFENNYGIYVTDYRGNVVREFALPGTSNEAASPQWLPAHGLVFNRNGNIWTKDYGSPTSEMELAIVQWPGRQWEPATSPNGEKIAFLSETNPAGEVLEGGPAIFITNPDGSEPQQVTNPENLAVLGSPTFSPDGSRLAFTAFGEFNEWEQGDIVSVLTSGEGFTPMSTVPEGISWDPDWLPNGDIAFTEEYYSGKMEFLRIPSGGGEVQTVLPPFTEGAWGWHFSGRQPVDWGTLTSETKTLAKRLLFLYAPTLKYSAGEAFRAVSIRSILETYSGTEPNDSNKLENGEGEVIQYANFHLNPSETEIWLAPKGQEYLTDPVVASETHRLDERNGSEEEDAAVWQENPKTADSVYGRAVYSEGRWWLQYWLWFYYDEFNLFGVGDHEGDWEMIQIGLGEQGNPQIATYSQHHNDEADSCNFDVLDWTVGSVPNVSPVAYVALGTHASYVRSGSSLGNFPYDIADGEGYVARTKALDMLVNEGSEFPVVGGDYGRDWSIWPGRWGSSLGKAESPMAPISQTEKWDHPGEFSEQAEGCPREEEGTPQARVQQIAPEPRGVAQPRIKAAVRNGKVFVHYQLLGDGRARGIEVAVLARKNVVSPRHRSAWHRAGTLRIPLPHGAGPYTVVARSLARDGSGSPILKVQLRDSVHYRHQRGSRADRRRSQVAQARSERQLATGPPVFGKGLLLHLPKPAVRAVERREKRIRSAGLRVLSAPSPSTVEVFGESVDQGLGRQLCMERHPSSVSVDDRALEC